MTTPRYTAKEAVATVLGLDFDEMNDARYQPTAWSMPIWDFGNGPFAARKAGTKKVPANRDDHLTGALYEWKPVGEWRGWEVLEGSDIDDGEDDAAFNMRPTRRAPR